MKQTINVTCQECGASVTLPDDGIKICTSCIERHNDSLRAIDSNGNTGAYANQSAIDQRERNS